MRLIIDINDNEYLGIKNYPDNITSYPVTIHLYEAVRNGTPIRKGRWVDDHCSECGCDIPAYIIDWRWQKDMDAKWCPMCGAKMEAKENYASVDSDAWCNTCESKYLETDCLGCAKYDEYNNLIALTNYKKESEE